MKNARNDCIMSEPLSEDQLVELIRSGRISTSRSVLKKRQTRTIDITSFKPTKRQTSEPRTTDSLSEVTTTSQKELDPEWLKTEREKAERNISAPRRDKRQQEEMRDASRY